MAGDSQSQLTSFGELPVFGFSVGAVFGATSSERSAASERAKRRASASGWRRATPRSSRARSPGVQDPSDASRIGLREIGAGTPFLVQAPWSAGKYPSSGYALKTACTPLMLAATLKMPWLPGPSYTLAMIFTVETPLSFTDRGRLAPRPARRFGRRAPGFDGPPHNRGFPRRESPAKSGTGAHAPLAVRRAPGWPPLRLVGRSLSDLVGTEGLGTRPRPHPLPEPKAPLRGTSSLAVVSPPPGPQPQRRPRNERAVP